MTELQRQTNEPLFPEVLWSKPINRKAAKRLVILGGSRGHFQQVELSYKAANQAGIGEVKLILPDSLAPQLGRLTGCLFVKSTAAGSISNSAASDICSWIDNSDGLLLAGDFSHNANTISLIEQLLNATDGPITIGKEVIQLMLYAPQNLFARTNRLLIGDTQTLVKLAAKLEISLQLKPQAGLLNKLHLLEQLAKVSALNLALIGDDLLIYSQNQSSLTALAQPNAALASGFLATYWLQHNQGFRALTSGAYALSQAAISQ